MIHFAWPWMLLFIPLPWLVGHRSRQQTREEVVFVPVPTTAKQSRSFISPKRWTVLIWLLLVLAAMRPEWLGVPQPVRPEGRPLLLAVDLSGSMATRDMDGQQTRLQVVQRVAGQFLSQRQGDQVGLIVFGTHPYLQAPMTLDLHTVTTMLNESLVGEAGSQTAIGDAIGFAIRHMKEHAQTTHERPVLILLTDGGNDAGLMPPVDAATIAAREGLRIYTIGVGAAVHQGFFGTTGNTDLDEASLKSIAAKTGGLYFRATDAHALQEIYKKINQLEPVSGQTQWFRPRTEMFLWPLALAWVLWMYLILWRRQRA